MIDRRFIKKHSDTKYIKNPCTHWWKHSRQLQSKCQSRQKKFMTTHKYISLRCWWWLGIRKPSHRWVNQQKHRQWQNEWELILQFCRLFIFGWGYLQAYDIFINAFNWYTYNLVLHKKNDKTLPSKWIYNQRMLYIFATTNTPLINWLWRKTYSGEIFHVHHSDHIWLLEAILLVITHLGTLTKVYIGGLQATTIRQIFKQHLPFNTWRRVSLFLDAPS